MAKMIREILIIGEGGDGVKTLGTIIALTASKAGLNISSHPIYGTARTGEKSIMEIMISDEAIKALTITQANILVSFLQDENKLNEIIKVYEAKGVSFEGSAKVNFNELNTEVFFKESGDAQKQSKNMLILGLLAGLTQGLITYNFFIEAIEKKFGKSKCRLSIQAFLEGYGKVTKLNDVICKSVLKKYEIKNEDTD